MGGSVFIRLYGLYIIFRLFFFFFVGMEFTALKGCGVELIHSHYGVIA